MRNCNGKWILKDYQLFCMFCLINCKLCTLLTIIHFFICFAGNNCSRFITNNDGILLNVSHLSVSRSHLHKYCIQTNNLQAKAVDAGGSVRHGEWADGGYFIKETPLFVTLLLQKTSSDTNTHTLWTFCVPLRPSNQQAQTLVREPETRFQRELHRDIVPPLQCMPPFFMLLCPSEIKSKANPH